MPGAQLASWRGQSSEGLPVRLLIRLITTLAFLASLTTSVALWLYGPQWSEERTAQVREIRTTASIVGIGGMLMTLLFRRRPRQRAREY
jgi:hypothetical protein